MNPHSGISGEKEFLRNMEYLNKIKKTLSQEGFFVVVKKSCRYIFAAICQQIDQSITKIFSKRYIKGFHKLFYYSFITEMAKKDKRIYWLGVPVSKLPLDLWLYQELIFKFKPDFIIETGTDRGGSALFFASMFDLVGQGQVITIDINNDSDKVTHPRIRKILGSSTSPEIVNQAKEILGDKKAIVILDSYHRKNHVLKEMEIYSQFVPLNGYLVVEDTNLNGHPVMPGWGLGPMEAVKDFLKHRYDFKIDKSLEKFMVTFYPRGFLKRIK